MMEKLAGNHLGAVWLSTEGMGRVQAEMAGHVARLHDHRRESYGPAARPGESYPRWLDHFGKAIQSEYESMGWQLAPSSRATVERLLPSLPEWLPETSRPTLVHGDLWSTNILVDDTDPGRPRIAGFVDGWANFSEVAVRAV